MNADRHLIYVLNQYWANEASHFAHVGGLLEAIANLGVGVTLIIEKGDAVPMFSNGGVRVFRVPPAAPWRRLVLLALMVRRAAKVAGSAVFVRIAVPASLASIVACAGTRARVFYWQSGTVHAADRAAKQGFKRWLWLATAWLPFRLVVWGCHRFVTGPESMVAYYRDHVQVPPTKLALLYNDVDIASFGGAVSSCDRWAERAKLGIPPHQLMLLFVHRLSPVRRTMDYVPAILSVMRDQPATVAVFAGDGPELEDLRRKIHEAGLDARCHTLGSVPHRQLPGLFAAADIFLNPSFAEGFPRVVLEAMAAGLPVVATDAGGTRDIVGVAQGKFIVPIEKPSQFADALHRLAIDSASRQRLSTENRATILRFDTARVAKMYEQVLFE